MNELIEILVSNEDFENVQEFYTSLEESREMLIDFLTWRAAGGTFKNEITSKRYVAASGKLLSLIK